MRQISLIPVRSYMLQIIKILDYLFIAFNYRYSLGCYIAGLANTYKHTLIPPSCRAALLIRHSPLNAASKYFSIQSSGNLYQDEVYLPFLVY